MWVLQTFDALLLLTRAWRVSPGVNETLTALVFFKVTPLAFVFSYEENMSACFVVCLSLRVGAGEKSSFSEQVFHFRRISQSLSLHSSVIQQDSLNFPLKKSTKMLLRKPAFLKGIVTLSSDQPRRPSARIPIVKSFRLFLCFNTNCISALHSASASPEERSACLV